MNKIYKNISRKLTKVVDNKLFQDSFWAILGNVLSKGLSLLSGILVARLLGSEIFGQFGVIKNTLLTSAIFATFGLGYTATKYVSEYKNKDSGYLILILKYSQRITFFFSICLALTIFIFSSFFAEKILNELELSIPLKIACIYIVFNAVNTTQIGIISGFGGFKKMTKINLYVGVFTFIITVGLSYFYDLYGALVALILSQIFNWYLNFKVINTYKANYDIGNNDSKTSKKYLKEILTFSFPIALQEAIYSFSSWGINVILVTYAAFSDVGVYSAAMQWNVIILFIPAILRNVILSHFSEKNDDVKAKNKILIRIVLFNFMITFLPYLFVVFFSDFIISFYGSSFAKMQSIFPILVLSSVFSSMSNVYTQAYLSDSRNWEMLILRIFRDIGVLMACYYLVKINFYNMPVVNLVSLAVLLFQGIFFVFMAFNYHKILIRKCR